MKISYKLPLTYAAISFASILAGAALVEAGHSRPILWGVAAVVCVGAVVAGFSVTRGISDALIRLKKSAIAIGKGDLDAAIPESRRDEIGELAEALQGMVKSLKGLMHRERELAMRVAEAEVIQLKALELEKAYTDLKDAQKELLRATRLATIGRMAATVAHEIRGPLAMIKNAACFLRMQGVGAGSAETESALGILCKEIDASDRIIHDLLEYSRSKCPVLHAVNINSLVKETLGRVQGLSKVDVVTLFDEALPLVRTDPLQIQEILYNIVTNAVEAMREEGRLTVRTARKGTFVAVTCTDTGAGMTPEECAQIFEPFFTTKKDGSGLGLAVALMLAEGLGGGIDVRSRPGKGTIFRVRLPADASPKS